MLTTFFEILGGWTHGPKHIAGAGFLTASFVPENVNMIIHSSRNIRISKCKYRDIELQNI